MNAAVSQQEMAAASGHGVPMGMFEGKHGGMESKGYESKGYESKGEVDRWEAPGEGKGGYK